MEEEPPQNASEQQEADETAELSFSLVETPVTIGDRVMVNGVLGGVLRYWGQVQFSHGLWAGVELDEPGSSRTALPIFS